MADVVEWLAVAIGLIGTALWAFDRSQLLASLCWCVSSVLWIGFAMSFSHNGLMTRDLVGLAFYVAGIATYLRKQRPALSHQVIEGLMSSRSACGYCSGQGVIRTGPGVVTCHCARAAA